MKLAEYRKINGLTRCELAKRLGVTPSVVTWWEDGTHFPTDENVWTIVEQTGGAVRPSDLWPPLRRKLSKMDAQLSEGRAA